MGNEVSSSAGRPGREPLLGQLLIEKGLIDERQLQHALTMQQRLGGSLGTVLLEKGAIAEGKLLEILGLQLSIPTISAAEMRHVPVEVLNLIPARLAQRYNILPLLRTNGSLHIATLHPSSLHIVEDEIHSFTSCALRPFIGIDFRVREAVQRHYGGRENLRLRSLARRLGQLASGQARASATGPRAPTGGDWDSSSSTGFSPRPLAESSATTTKEPSSRADVDRLVHLVDRLSGSQPPGPDVHSEPSPPAPGKEESAGVDRPADSAERLEPTRGVDRFAGLEIPDQRQPSTTYEVAPLVSTHPAERLDEVATLLQQAELRDDVAAAVLDYCAPFFARRMLFARRRDEIVGWIGAGRWLDHASLSKVVLSTAEPSIFSRLEHEGAMHCGAIAPLPAHRILRPLFSGVEPRECLVLPIRLVGKIACYLWADNGRGDVGGAPLAEIRQLGVKAGHALEICVLRNRIRSSGPG